MWYSMILENFYGIFMQVVSDCLILEVGEYVVYVLGSFFCDNFENVSFMIVVDLELVCVIFKFLVWVIKCIICI